MEPCALEVNGEQPALVGKLSLDLLVEEVWHQGRVSSPANVTWIHDGRGWHRLYFDCGIVFWRRSPIGPVAYDMPELQSRVEIVDLGRAFGFAGRVITDIAVPAIFGGAEVALGFDSGASIRIRNVEDRTTYGCTG